MQEEKLQDDYHEALKLGEVLVAYARVMMIGPGGVGKSSLLRGLMNQKLPQKAESTMLADTKTLKPHFWAKTGQAEDSYWEEVTNEDEIQELAGLVHLVALTKSGAANPSRVAKILSSITVAAAVSVFYPLGFIPRNVQAIDQEFVSSIKDIVVRDTLRRALESTNSSLERPAAPQSEVLMHVWDCGGQPAFLDVLPAFLTSRTMFLLFFDARQDLLSKCKMLCHKEGRVVSTPYDYTVLQLLTQWMACIHATLTSQNVESFNPVSSSFITQSGKTLATKDEETDISRRQRSSQSSPSTTPSTHTEENSGKQHTEESKFPRIIPVGTHGDDPAVEGKKEEILDTLRSHCEDKAFIQLLLDGVIVDNTTAGKQDEDPGFTYIRRKVHNFATDDLAIPTPIAWVLFRKVLQKVAEDKHCPIVSYQEAVAVGKACGIPESILPSVLHFYHELAVFLHYAQIESLSHSIITDPQWLIRQLGKLLAPEEMQQEVSNKAFWKPLRENGVLVQPLYEEVWKQKQSLGLTGPQSFADLLEHFLLAARIDPLRKFSQFRGRKYFVPAALQLYSENKDSRTECTPLKKSSPLHLTFNTQYVPPGFFTRLATILAKGSTCHLLFEQGIFRNKLTFAYQSDEFTIVEHFTSVQITVVRTEDRQSHMPTFRSVCHSIMELIQECSATVCQWLPSVKVEVALCCEQCPDKNHFILIPPGTTTSSVLKLRCQAAIKCRPSTHQQIWLTIPDTPEHLAQKGNLSDAELQGVADAIQRDEKLEELADALEVVPLLQSIEGEANAPFILLQRWRLDVESAHSLLVHHLRCIGLTGTADRLHYREFCCLSDSSTRTHPASHPAQKDNLSDAELQGVADAIQRYEKLEELADALEVVPLLQSIEGEANAPFILLQRWRLDVESGLKAHSLLVHHLRCIGMTRTADRLQYREFLCLSDPSTRTHPASCPSEPLSLSHIISCSRGIDADADLSLLAAVLDIHDEEVATIKSKFKLANGQAVQMLKKWQSPGTHTRQELTTMLQSAGFLQAAQNLIVENTSTTKQELMQELVTHVRTTEWYRLGILLRLDVYKLEQIRVDARGSQESLILMFDTWLKTCENPSWVDVVRALKAIGENNLGAKLEQKFCK